VPGARIDLPGDPGVGPPRVGLAQEQVPVEQRRVEQRHWQPCRRDQVPQIAFGRGSDAVGDLGQNRAKHGGASDRALAEFGGQLADRAPAQLDRVRDDGPDVSRVG